MPQTSGLTPAFCDGLLMNSNPTSTGTKYRLAADQAALIRTNPPRICSIFEGAAYLSCSPRKLRDLIAAGRVKSARVGVKIVVRREWLDAFLGD